ncbi:MAG: hypothetical protein JXQ75_15415 [Phycisphaerae bacterium]|nr:hypothetical protein [Phycisphaerae bacterium]
MPSHPFTRASSLGLSITMFLALANTGVAGPRDEKVIVIEGSAAGTNANAMEQARLDALRRAVEQACGTFLSSQTKTEDYKAIYDKAMSFAVGYVTGFEVLDRRVEDGVSYCKLRAKVSTASFEKEWARLRHTIEAEGNPRCVVVVVEDNDVDDHVGPKTNGVVQSIIENFFLDKGVQLMDKGASDQAKNRDIELAALNDDINKLAAMAAAFKADVVIRGVAEGRRAGSSELGGRTVYKWSGTISIRAYHTDSAQLIMSNTYSATKTSVNENAGGDEVLKECAQDNAAKILRDIGKSWRERQNIRRTVQLTLENCSRPDFKSFEAAMRPVTGVQEIRLKELVNNVCQVEIDWAYDVERLVVRIEELEVPGTRYEITEQTHDRVTVKLVKEESKTGSA